MELLSKLIKGNRGNQARKWLRDQDESEWSLKTSLMLRFVAEQSQWFRGQREKSISYVDCFHRYRCVFLSLSLNPVVMVDALFEQFHESCPLSPRNILSNPCEITLRIHSGVEQQMSVCLLCAVK